MAKRHRQMTVSGRQAHSEKVIWGRDVPSKLVETRNALLSLGFSNSGSLHQEMHKVKRLFRQPLPTGNLHFVAQLPQRFGDLLAVLSLDFDHALFHRPTAAANLLEFCRQFLHVCI